MRKKQQKENNRIHRRTKFIAENHSKQIFVRIFSRKVFSFGLEFFSIKDNERKATGSFKKKQQKLTRRKNTFA